MPMCACRRIFWPTLSRRCAMAKTGLVNCFYRLANPATAAMRCEAVAINADFWSQVLQAATPQAARLRPRRGHAHPAQIARRNRRLRRVGKLPRRRLSTRPPHRAKRPSHRALPRGRGMLGRADELERRLETSTPLGAHHPRLPAHAVFFQHPGQRHALAAAVADRGAGSVKNILPSAPGRRVFVNPDRPCAKSTAAIYAIARKTWRRRGWCR